jgi:C1A family cysteine protease
MAEVFENHGLGWLPGYPDVRDHTPDEDTVHPRRRASSTDETVPVKEMLQNAGAAQPRTDAALPESVLDLEQSFSPVEDQQTLGSCTAQAGVGLVEYFERRAFGRHMDASRLFLYKATRNLMQRDGDTGAFLRTTMGALVLFGVPPEEYYPYDAARFDEEPPAFCYAFAQNYQSIDYYRLDASGSPSEELLHRIKTNIASKLPSMFGFSVYDSISDADDTGEIPYPDRSERLVGGHAVIAMGYDDQKKIGNEQGALRIRNSWGAQWGDNGYGWLPYRYVLDGLANDWWSILKNEWIATGAFKP